MSDFYARDLAEIHAEGFGALGAAAAQVVREALGDRITGARIVDIGCGAGALSTPLSEAGAEVWGLELSPDLLDIARRRAPRAVFRQGSLHEADLPEADVVCAIGEEAEGILTRRITTFRETGGTWRRSQEVHRLALLAPDQVLAALDAAGFEAETLPGYGALSLPAGLQAYRAVRS